MPRRQSQASRLCIICFSLRTAVCFALSRWGRFVLLFRHKAFPAGVLRRHFAQQGLSVAIHVQKTRSNADEQKNQLAPGAGAKPVVNAVAYGKTHCGAAHQMQANDPCVGHGFHAGLLLLKKILERHKASAHVAGTCKRHGPLNAVQIITGDPTRQ